MKSRKNRFRRRPPAEKEKEKPFFDKQSIKEKTAFFANTGIQPRLRIGKSDDPQEKEAESTARQMTAQPVQKAEKKEEEKPVQKAEKKEEEKPVQKEEKKEEEKPVRKEEKKEEEKPVQKAEKKEEEKPVQKAEKKEEEKPVQKAEKKEEEQPVQKAAKKDDDGQPAVTLEQLLSSRKGRGFKLPYEVRAEMEKKFDAHFDEVRIHTDKEAEEICEELHALAFTHGCDIYFNAGQYNPDSASGKELLAHELTHVVQQNY